MLFGYFKTVFVTRSEELIFLGITTSPNRAYGMNDIFRYQLISLGDLCLSRWTSSQSATFFLKLRSGFPVNSSVHSASSQEGRISSIDNRIGFFFGNITQNDLNISLRINNFHNL